MKKHEGRLALFPWRQVIGLIFRLLIYYWPNKELVDLDPSNLWLLYAIEKEEGGLNCDYDADLSGTYCELCIIEAGLYLYWTDLRTTF